MSSDQPISPPPAAKPQVGYINARGTIYKVKGAEPLPVKSPAEQRRDSLRQHGFMALLQGAAKRRHVERLEADRQKALDTIRDARKVSGEVIADMGNGTVVKLTETQATVLEKHLENAGQKLRRLMPEQNTKDVFVQPTYSIEEKPNEPSTEPNSQPS